MRALPCAPTHARAFAEVAARYPDAPAVVAGATLNYARLARRSALIAHQLVATDAGSHVALLCPNAEAAASGLLGIWGAGAGALLLDPANPDTRLLAMLRMKPISDLLTDRTLAHRANALAAAAGLRVHAVGERESDAAYPARESTPEDDAAIVFTSGSTGTPKGCVESEADSLERCRLYGELLRLAPGNVVGVVHHYAGSRMQPNSALLRGAAVAYYDFARLGLAPLPDWIEHHRVDSMRLFPTTFRQLAAGMRRGQRLDALRTVVLTGEAALASDVALLRRVAPQARCLSVYSSTETGPLMALEVLPDAALEAGPLPLGQPLPGKQIALEDADGRAVAEGETGEIVVRTSHVFKGYLGAPPGDARLQAEMDGTLRFRTGDLARHDSGGRLWHAGRRDAQVKVRGQRVELAEVESALLQCDGVALAAVTTLEYGPGRASLIAYVTPQGTLDPRELRRQLALELPGAMMPSRIEFVSELPVGDTGKVDRSALPPTRPFESAPDARLRSRTETILASIWASLLAAESLHADSDFFDLGGDSLLAATMLMEVETQLEVRLPLSVLASASSLTSLAAVIDAPQAFLARYDSVIPILERGARTVFAIAGIGGPVLSFVQLSRHLHGAMRLLGLEPPASGWPEPVSMESMAAHYVRAIRAVQPEGPYRLVGASYGGLVSFAIATLLEAQGQVVEWVCMLDSYRPGATVQAAAALRLDAEAEQSAVVAQHRRAAHGYLPSAPLAAPLHLAVVIEYPLIPDDPRDWRRFTLRAPQLHPVAGLHGAFHTPPQYPGVVALLEALIDPSRPKPPALPASAFDLPPPGLLQPYRGGGSGTLMASLPDSGPVRLEGCFEAHDTAAPPGRMLVQGDGAYLGWSAFLRPAELVETDGQRRSRYPLELKIRPGQSASRYTVVVLDPDDRPMIALRCADARSGIAR